MVKQPPPYVPIKYLIGGVDTFVGGLLVRRLRNDHLHPDNPHRLLGTVCHSEGDVPVPEGVRKVIDVLSILFRLAKSSSSKKLFLTLMSSSTIWTLATWKRRSSLFRLSKCTSSKKKRHLFVSAMWWHGQKLPRNKKRTTKNKKTTLMIPHNNPTLNKRKNKPNLKAKKKRKKNSMLGFKKKIISWENLILHMKKSNPLRLCVWLQESQSPIWKHT